MKQLSRGRGFTIAETMVYLVIFGIMMAFIVTLNIEGSRFFRSGSAAVDIQEDLNRALLRIQSDIQESDPRGIGIGYVNAPGSAAFYPSPSNGYVCTGSCTQAAPQMTTAIIMLSPRQVNSTLGFDPYLTSTQSCSSNPGTPCWQAWVGYYMSPNPTTGTANTAYTLMRVEFSIAGSGINAGPSSGPTITPGMPCAGANCSGSWETQLRNAGGSKITLSTSVNSFLVTNPASSSLYADPFNFDAPTGGNSTISFVGLPAFWINMQALEYPSTTVANKGRNFVQAVTRN